MIYAALAVFILGAVLLTLALRGRRLDNNPICRQCRFDLVGTPSDPAFQPAQNSPPEPAPRCPECGATITSPRALRIGNRQRCPRIAVLGALLLLAGLIPGGLLAWGHAAGVDWNQHKPAWWLAGDLKSSDLATSEDAAGEFSRRIAERTLSAHWRDHVLSTALTRYIDDQAPWSQAWTDLLDQAWNLELFTEAQRELYARHAPVISLDGRPQAVAGEEWMMQLHVRSPRLGDLPSLWLRSERLSAALNGEPLERPVGGGGATSLSSGSSGTLSQGVRFDHEPGTYTYSARWRFRVQTSHSHREEPIAEWEEELSTQIEILPAGTQLIRLVTPADMAERIRQSIRTVNIGIRQRDGRPPTTEGTIHIDSPPMACAFAVWWRYPDETAEGGHREIEIGRARGEPGRGHGTGLHTELPPGFAAEKIDIILRPCTNAAMNLIGVDEIWGEEVILHDVPVRRD